MSAGKFLNPFNYIRYIRNRMLNMRIRYGSPLTVWVEALGEKICFIVTSDKEYWMRAKGSYSAEETTMSWISNYIKQGDVVYDIGANVGAYSLLIGKKMGTGGTVYSFEPESSNYYSLNRNIVANRLSGIVTGICLAFDRALKLDQFFISSVIPGSATHSVGKAESDGIEFSPEHIQGIMTMSLDQFVALEGIKFPNHIKIDVDGNEGLIINGGAKTLSDPKVKTLVIEIAENISQGEIERKIESYGFVQAQLEEWESGKHGKVFNILYSRR